MQIPDKIISRDKIIVRTGVIGIIANVILSALSISVIIIKSVKSYSNLTAIEFACAVSPSLVANNSISL